MVRLTVSPEVSRSVSADAPTSNGGALTTISVQAGKAKIELAVLKVNARTFRRVFSRSPHVSC